MAIVNGDIKSHIKENLKAVSTCNFRGQQSECYNALNDLRKYGCKGFCVAQTRSWIEQHYPSLTDEEITSILEEILTD